MATVVDNLPSRPFTDKQIVLNIFKFKKSSQVYRCSCISTQAGTLSADTGGDQYELKDMSSTSID